MFIIIEGPDGTGKSSLVQRIVDTCSSDHDITKLKAGPPQPGSTPFDEYVTPIINYKPRNFMARPELMICDRWHIGELVYPAVFKRSTQMTTFQFRWIESYLVARGAIIVHMVDTVDRLQAVLSQRGDDLVRPDQAGQMIELFWTAIRETRLPVIDVEARDTSDFTIKHILETALVHEFRISHPHMGWSQSTER